MPSLPLSPSQLKEGDSGHGGYARAFAFFSEAHLTSSVEIVWLGAPARSKWPPWRDHSWPPRAPRAACRGLGLLSALCGSGPSAQIPP